MDTLSTNFNEELCDIFFDNPDYYLDAHYQNNWLKNKYESFKSQSGKKMTNIQCSDQDIEKDNQ